MHLRSVQPISLGTLHASRPWPMASRYAVRLLTVFVVFLGCAALLLPLALAHSLLGPWAVQGLHVGRLQLHVPASQAVCTASAHFEGVQSW